MNAPLCCSWVRLVLLGILPVTATISLNCCLYWAVRRARLERYSRPDQLRHPPSAAIALVLLSRIPLYCTLHRWSWTGAQTASWSGRLNIQTQQSQVQTLNVKLLNRNNKNSFQTYYHWLRLFKHFHFHRIQISCLKNIFLENKISAREFSGGAEHLAGVDTMQSGRSKSEQRLSLVLIMIALIFILSSVPRLVIMMYDIIIIDTLRFAFTIQLYFCLD